MNEIERIYPDYDPLKDPVIQEEYETILKEQENDRNHKKV